MKLTDKQQRHVRTALRFLHFKVGSWQPLADALEMKADSLVKVVNARGRDVTARLAYNVAQLADAPIDDLLSGRLLSSRTCPHCGRPPDDFLDEETVVQDAGRSPKSRGLDHAAPTEFAEHDFEGPFELGHAILDDSYGVYLLVGVVEDAPSKFVVVYVGRGHFRGQLAKHAAAGRARYFYLRHLPNASKAFREECRLFHKYGETEYLDNKIHPQVPAGIAVGSPRCHMRGCDGGED